MMKLRRALTTAAPLLTGWYLVMPPVISGTNYVATQAPLQNWQLLGSYDSAEQCGSERARFQATTAHLSLQLRTQLDGSMCISTDDLRWLQ